jgi:hypothetical protein
MRNLGLMGESFFSHLCAEDELIANGSVIDKTGWDFIVEFQYKNNTEIHELPITCKVQVKSTDTFGKNNQIKLSNLRRMCTEQVPSFFLFLNYMGKNQVQDAYLVHVDTKLIHKVLKKLYVINNDTDLSKINKKTMTINYNDSHKLELLNGKCLKENLLIHIGENYEQYIIDKIEFLKTTGYESGHGIFTFTTKGEESVNDLIDASMGIDKEIQVYGFEGRKTRFEISDKDHFVKHEISTIKIENPDPLSSGYITFKETKFSPGYKFSAQLYNSPFNNFVSGEFKKLRIKCEFLDIIISLGNDGSKLNFNLGAGLRLSINDFICAIKILKAFATGNKIYYVTEFQDLENFESVLHGGVTSLDENINKALTILEQVQYLIGKFNSNVNIDISFEELFYYENEISNLYKVMASEAGFFRVNTEILDDYVDIDQSSVMISLIFSRIGNFRMGVLFVLIGSLELDADNRYQLNPKSKVIEHKILVPIQKTIEKEELVKLVDIVKNKYESDHNVMTFFDD